MKRSAELFAVVWLLAQSVADCSEAPGVQPGFESLYYRAVILGSGQFVAVGPGSAIRTSWDGVTWTARNSGNPSSLYGVAYGNGLFVAVGNEGAIVASTDGISWTPRDSGTDDRLRGIIFADGIFVAVGY